MGRLLKDLSTFNPLDTNLDLSQTNKTLNVSIILCLIVWFPLAYINGQSPEKEEKKKR